MTKDFAKKSRSPSSHKRQPAARRSKVPGWVWLFTGAILGAFITFLMYLSGIAPQPNSGTHNAPAKKTEDNNKADIPKPRFDFYTMLKESEIEVNIDRDFEAKSPNNPPVITKEYILQAGSFKRKEDADRMRAELIMMNLDAYMETSSIRNGEIWHRVLAGPYDNRSKMAKARSILVSNDITPLLLTRKKKP